MTWLVRDANGSLQRVTEPKGRVLDTDFVTQGIEKEDIFAKSFAAQISDPYWALELSKSVSQHHKTALAVAHSLSETTDTVIETASPDRVIPLVQARQGHFRLSLSQRLSILFAFLTSALVWLGTILRHSTRRQTITAKNVIAVHGEMSTRTRHVLSSVKSDTTLLILGRPKAALAEVAKSFAPLIKTTPKAVIRPLTYRAAFAALANSFATLNAGRKAITSCGYMPSFRDLTAMFFRHIQGHAHANWWAASGLTPDTVTFGHTGLADTSRFEAAIQATGTKTVHAVHGVSVGWNFVAASTTAHWHCQHDADWHNRLGGYGENRAEPLAKPTPIAPKRGWRVYSNYAHPTHSAYAARGLQAELDLIGLVTSAAQKAGVPLGDILWNLHPAHKNLPNAQVEALYAALKSAQIPYNTDPITHADLQGEAFILTTPSTIALDTLSVGKLPILIQTYPSPENAVAAAFPLRASSATTLNAAFEDLRKTGAHAKLFDTTFDRIGPSRPFHIGQS